LKRTEGDVKNYLKVKKIDCSPKIKIWCYEKKQSEPHQGCLKSKSRW
jgi:hypothetical protein